MKKAILLASFVCSIVLAACTKHESTKYQSAGTITGPDFRNCACCGGYYIKIDGQQYHLNTLPAGSGINLDKDAAPIHVLLNWHRDTQSCMSDLIIVDAIRKL